MNNSLTKPTIITFDLHGVLFKRNYIKMARLFVQPKNVVLLIKYAFNPRFIYDCVRLLYHKTIPCIILEHLYTKYPEIAPFVLAVANCQRPVTKTIALLKQLQQNNISLHLFSNIGTRALDDLRKQYPETFSHFCTIATPGSHNNFIAKPHINAFKEYLALSKAASCQIIFMDDKPRNIAIAQSLGMRTILVNRQNIIDTQLQKFFTQNVANIKGPI